VKDGPHRSVSQGFQPVAQIRRGRERFHMRGLPIPRKVACCPINNVTSCPRADKNVAKSDPSLPVEKFVSRRTSSSDS